MHYGTNIIVSANGRRNEATLGISCVSKSVVSVMASFVKLQKRTDYVCLVYRVWRKPTVQLTNVGLT